MLMNEMRTFSKTLLTSHRRGSKTKTYPIIRDNLSSPDCGPWISLRKLSFMEEWVTSDLGKYTVNMDLYLITLKSPVRTSVILVEGTQWEGQQVTGMRPDERYSEVGCPGT